MYANIQEALVLYEDVRSNSETEVGRRIPVLCIFYSNIPRTHPYINKEQKRVMYLRNNQCSTIVYRPIYHCLEFKCEGI